MPGQGAGNINRDIARRTMDPYLNIHFSSYSTKTINFLEIWCIVNLFRLIICNIGQYLTTIWPPLDVLWAKKWEKILIISISIAFCTPRTILIIARKISVWEQFFYKGYTNSLIDTCMLKVVCATGPQDFSHVAPVN